MSCVVSLIHNDELYIGADSGVFLEDCIIPAHFDKVFWKGPFLVGAVGSVRSSQIIRYGMEVSDLEGRDPVEFLVNEFTTRMREVLGEMGKSVSGEDGDAVSASLLVGTRDSEKKLRLFMIGHDFSVIEPSRRFFSAGAASEAAMGFIEGALPYQKKYWSPVPFIRDALKVAGKYSAWIKEPYRVAVFGTEEIH